MDMIGTVTRKPLFWILTAILACASAVFTYHYYAHSNPLITLDITMDRKKALSKAQELSIQNGWIPQEHDSAVMFQSDMFLQFFVELEGGGKEKFLEMMHTKLFEPYTWQVRHFKEKTTEEVHISFTPDGAPYRFTQKLAETDMRPTLSFEEARTRAQEIAVNDWGISFEPYEEIETSKDQKPNGRLDHTFVYQRKDAQLGQEGKYRLRLVVSGDIVTEVNPFVFIPETFTRRYNEMRASNNTISTMGAMGFLLLYAFLGCIVGGFYFFRRRLIDFKQAFLWAGCLALLKGLSALNHLPFLWMSYDTASTPTSFLSQYFLVSILGAVATFAFLSIAFSVALTWDRLAFPTRVNFWKLWSPTTGSSVIVLGQTAGGYLFAIIFLGLATAIYLFLTKVMGWWSPADTLTDPNILATYIPWADAFTNSLQAGFMEEALFRAIPLAAAALIGRYYKREKLFVGIAFILQALIFAACHANYPQQPGYFRLIELLIPSGIFGSLYLLFGLLPGLLAHFLYDLFLFALPILIAHTAWAWVSKIIILLLALFPLGVVLYRKSKQPEWMNPSENDYNKNREELSAPEEELHSAQAPSLEGAPLSPRTQKGIYLAGLAGLVLFVTSTQFKSDTPSLDISKDVVLETAQDRFDHETIETSVGMNWQALPFIASAATDQEKFVWQTQGKAKYYELLGSYLTPPAWAIRYASFTGDLIARAEEFSVLVGPEGNIIRTNLALPESKPGASLLQGQARGIALHAIETDLGFTTERLKEISAIAHDRPARKDWVFTFQDTQVPLEHEGQARIAVTIAGDRVTNIRQFVFTPEQWVRDEQEKTTYFSIMGLILGFIKIFLICAAFFLLQRRLFAPLHLRQAGYWALFLIPLTVVALFNGLPQLIATSCNTAQPYSSQLFVLLSTSLALATIGALFLSLGAAQVRNILIALSPLPGYKVALLGVCSQFILEGATAAVLACAPRYMPYIPQYLPLNDYSSLFTLCSSNISLVILNALVFILCTTAVILVTDSGSRYRRLSYILLFLLGFTSPLVTAQVSISMHLLCGLISGIVVVTLYQLLFRKDQTSGIMMGATMLAVRILMQGIAQPYPHALVHSLIATTIIFIGSLYWFYSLRKISIS